MSVTLAAQSYKTNNNEYGLLQVDIDLTNTKITKDTAFEFMLPNVDDGSYGDAGCFIHKRGGDHEVTGLEYLKSSSSWFKKDEGYKIDGKIPSDYSESFNIVCHVQAPSSSVAEKKATFKIGDNSTEFTITVVQNQIAKGVKYHSTGDLSKSGLRIKVDKAKNSFNSLVVGSVNLVSNEFADKKCDYKLNGNTYAATVVSDGETMSFVLGEEVATEKSLSLTCSSDSGVSAKKIVPGYPAIVGLAAVDSKDADKLTADANVSFVLGEMENSSVSVATGAAVIAVVASAFALFF